MAVAAGIAAAQPAPLIALRGKAIQGGWMRGQAPAGTTALLLDGKPVPLAADGAFLIAFDRDAAPQATLVAQRSGLPDLVQPIAVAPRAWAIQNVNVALRPPGLPDAEFQRIRAGELAQIKAARAQATDAQGWRQAMLKPAAGRISGHFGSQRIYQGQPGAYHSGTDIAGGAGAPILAPADGVVVLAAETPFTLEGHLVILDHGMGLNSAFLHASVLKVKVGDRVVQGQEIARIGSTGRATGPHLHWGLTWQGKRLDPELFL
ncbi:M23 family metallopeptidase [Novosphingobium sp. HBC54]|uniref:M23 family metallopeptidase n=1 Tax=Novosphingobium cyanobacteriorum TaxID=3024215 RepID=A0ABT6CGI0_9SPHN|nr:M23 family metallopeptidase [Novosphingobium cyanobacteriorum]MDF8333035.1 M23 family metallopeptidase [Novosphingobium cyanobacteriorum]